MQRHKKLYLVYLIIFMLSMISAYALNEMPNSLIGADDQAYQGSGRSLINSQDYDTIIYSINAIGISQKIPPLFYDINGDSINEILVVVGTSVNIYNFVAGSGLIYNNTFTTNLTIIDGMKIYPYDGDIFLLISGHISIYGYIQERVWDAASNNFKNYNITHYFGVYSTHINPFACDIVTGNCAVEVNGGQTATGYSFRLDNSTTYISTVATHTYSATGTPTFCDNVIPDMAVGDTDGDGNNEFVTTHAYTSTASTTAAVDVYDITSNVMSAKYVAAPLIHVSNSCGPYTFLYSAPLIMDTIDNGAQKEIVMASSPSAVGQFRQYVFSYSPASGGSYAEYSHHPNVDSAEGYIVSNPVRARVFDNYAPNNINDFCTLGVSSGNATMISCGSNKGTLYVLGIPILTAYNFFDLNDSAVWTPSGSLAQNYLYSLYASNSYYTDFITPYGLIAVGGSLGWASDIAGNYRALNLYSVNYGNGIMFPAFGNNDAEDGLFDYGFVTPSSFLYIDDAFVNLNAKIDDYCINPHPASVWRTNTTLEVIITPVDAETNNVRAEAILYAGTTFEKDSGVSADFPSGRQITFNFLVNQSINNGVLTLKAQDNKAEHNSSFDTISIPISVSDSGTVVYGDSQLCVDGLIAQNAAAAAAINDTEAAYAQNATRTDNIARRVFTYLGNIIDIPVVALVLLFFLILDIIILVLMHRIIILAFASMVLIDIIGLFFSYGVGIIDAALLTILTALILIIGAVSIAFTWNKISSG